MLHRWHRCSRGASTLICYRCSVWTPYPAALYFRPTSPAPRLPNRLDRRLAKVDLPLLSLVYQLRLSYKITARTSALPRSLHHTRSTSSTPPPSKRVPPSSVRATACLKYGLLSVSRTPVSSSSHFDTLQVPHSSPCILNHSAGAAVALAAFVLVACNAPAVQAAEIPSQGGTTVAAEACGWVRSLSRSVPTSNATSGARADLAPLQSYQCPQTAPCCSNSGFCSSGVACLAGCDPLGSHNTSYCAPQPVCQSSNYTFTDDSRLNYNISGYTGDASKWDWTVDTVRRSFSRPATPFPSPRRLSAAAAPSPCSQSPLLLSPRISMQSR